MRKLIDNKIIYSRLIKSTINFGLITVFLSTTPSIMAYSKPTDVSTVLENPVIHQKRVIKGTIIDDLGETVIGANVTIKGTAMGTITDMDGQFLISVPNNEVVLVVSYIGYVTQEIKPGKKLKLLIRLSENTQVLDEVIVVGYGTQKKESVLGAITQVGSEKLMKSGTSSITNAIAGKLSGVLTMQQSGQPGSNDSEIVIRGLSSWNGSQPLVLVDGVERDFTDLDPNEINTISVLKDASATAVFGAKGANGVIVVTTKRGIESKPKLDFSASYGMEMPTKTPDYIDSYTTMNMLNVGLMNNGAFQDLIPQEALNEYRNPSTPLNGLKYPNVDWFNLLTKTFAPTFNANFNLRGGTDFIKYFCSLGYVHQGSVFEGYKEGHVDTQHRSDRFNYRTNLDFNLTRKTVLSMNVGGDVTINNAPSASPWRNMYQTSGARYPAYYPSWVLEEVTDLDYPDATGDRLTMPYGGEVTGNPYNDFNQGSFNEYTSSKLFTDLILKQDLDFITEGLSAKGKIALSTYYKNKSLTSSWKFPQYQLHFDKIGTGMNPWQREGEGNETWVQSPLDINVGGLEGGYYSNLYYEFGLNYQRKFGEHDVSGLALVNRQQKNAGTEFAYFNESWVGRVTYNFAGKYLIEGNVGYTGSERFAPENRFGFFPSGAVGWIVSEEKFFQEALPWINKLKIRYSDGLVGSDKASERWLYQSDYSKSGGYIYEDKAPNKYSQWEEARKRDIGVEMGFLENMITVGVDFFDEKRDKMLLTPRSSTVFIGNSFKQLNLGKLKKHGVEVELEFNKTTQNNLNYFVKGVFGYNDNRIIFKDDLPYAPSYRQDAGKPLGSQNSGVIVTGGGYYTSVDDIHNNPSPITPDKLNVGDYKFLDYSADGNIDVNDKYPIEGSLFPPITFSLSGGLSYRNFDFSFMFQGNSGKYVDFNQTYEVEFCKGTWRVHESQLDYWSPDNQDVNHSTLHYSGTGNAALLSWGGGESDKGYGIKVQDRFWRNADYIRLKEVYIGYTIKSKYLNKIAGISNLVVYASGNNLFTLTDLIEGDPERKDFQQGYYPQMTTYKLGLRVAF